MGYIFRPPKAAIDFSWKLEDVLVWLGRGGREMGIRGHRERKLGTTVSVRSLPDHTTTDGTYVRVTLYGTDIARIYEDRVDVGGIDTHQTGATRWWTNQILSSNLTAYTVVGSEDFHYYANVFDGEGRIQFPLNNQTIRRTA